MHFLQIFKITSFQRFFRNLEGVKYHEVIQKPCSPSGLQYQLLDNYDLKALVPQFIMIPGNLDKTISVSLSIFVES